jgi:hypothetical protein
MAGGSGTKASRDARDERMLDERERGGAHFGNGARVVT